MVINATLFVQAFNFYIFYLLLRFLLFKPVITIIDDETKEITKIVDSIDQQRRSIEIKDKELRYYWQASREYFQQQWPAYTQQEVLIHCDESIDSDDMSIQVAADIDTLIAQVTESLKEKLKNVH